MLEISFDTAIYSNVYHEFLRSVKTLAISVEVHLCLAAFQIPFK